MMWLICVYNSATGRHVTYLSEIGPIELFHFLNRDVAHEGVWNIINHLLLNDGELEDQLRDSFEEQGMSIVTQEMYNDSL